MQKLNLFTGGHPFQVDDLAISQEGLIDALKGVSRGFGGSDSFIFYGASITTTVTLFTVTVTVTAGHIYYNGEIYPVAAQTFTYNTFTIGALYWRINELILPPSPVTYQDAISRNVHVKRSMSCVFTAAPIPGTDVSISLVPRYVAPTGVPKGLISMFSGTAAPSGWALCNGSNGTPDLRGRFIVGYNPTDTDYDQPGNLSTGGTTTGDQGGAKSVTLTGTQSGTSVHGHGHTLGTSSAGNHTHQIPSDSGTSGAGGITRRSDSSSNGATTSDAAGTHSHSVTGGITNSVNTNALDAHENRPPYYTLAYIIKL